MVNLKFKLIHNLRSFQWTGWLFDVNISNASKRREESTEGGFKKWVNN